MDPAQLAATLDRVVVNALRVDSNSIRIELNPVSLGKVLLQCKETGEGLSVDISVQSDPIRALLANQEQDLRLNLESQGIQMGRFSVSCRDGEGRPDGGSSDRRRDSDPQGGQPDFFADEATEDERPAQRIPMPGARRNRWIA
jgi:flagellar hook-length control protein FliK